MRSILSECRCKVTGGINTFRPGDLETLYITLEQQGRARYIFADGTVNSPAAFVSAIMNREDVWLYVGYDRENAPLAVALLDTFKGTTAHIHFAFLRGEGTAHSRVIGSTFLNLLFHGGLTALFGCTPIAFRHSRFYAKALGFRELAVIPGGCPILNQRTGVTTYHDGWLGLCTPQTLINHSSHQEV